MLTEISAGQWRELIELALFFAQSEPWKWMDDSQVVGVLHPQTQEKAYCSVMGRESEFKALAIYPGREGWWSYLQINQEEADTDPNEIMYKQHCLVISFELRARADADDLALLRHAGLKDHDLKWIPSFRSYLPGFVPATPSGDEFQWLSLVLPQICVAVQEIHAGKHVVPEQGLDKEGRLLFRSIDPAIGDWQSAWLKPDPQANFSPPQAQLSEELAIAARAMPQTEDMWLVEEFFVPEPAEDQEGERAFFPRALLFFDIEMQEFRGMSLLHPDTWPAAVAESLVEMLLAQGRRPGQIVVSKKENLILLKPFCKALSIGIHLETTLDILPDLRDAVLEMWREQDAE